MVYMPESYMGATGYCTGQGSFKVLKTHMGWSPGFCMSNKAPDDVGLWSTLRVASLQTVTL